MFRSRVTFSGSRFITDFVHELSFNSLPAVVVEQAKRCMLDTIGAGIAGTQTELSRIIRNYAVANHGGKGAALWCDGRELSAPGAALANGFTVDSLDIHDGQIECKGHIGAAVVPALFACATEAPKTISGEELLCTTVMAYELATRAGIALHATAKDYHTSGAWNALGCAAIVSRWHGLTHEQTHHALGIAEYHGPRSQMMRCVDHPTMVKDGSGWGAMAGVAAGLLAKDGFTGAPAVTLKQTGDTSNGNNVWRDLGKRWYIMEQYFKPQAVCRWAQPAITAALLLKKKHRLSSENIERVSVETFHEAKRLQVVEPDTTEQAQYSLPFAIAAALKHGRLGVKQLSGEGLRDAEVLRISRCVSISEVAQFNDVFPKKRFARVSIDTTHGKCVSTGDTEAMWGENSPPTTARLHEKFLWLCEDQLPETRAREILEAVEHCEDTKSVQSIQLLLNKPFR